MRQLNGVQRAVSGYMGGRLPDPHYKEVCSGTSGHAEAVQVSFDPALLSLNELLEVFFFSHDPTTLNRQGNDIGTQYRSAIFTHNPQQQAFALEFIAGLDRAHGLAAPVVTEVTPAGIFYPAEDYHQNYFANNARQPYCQVVVAPKLANLRQHFAGKLNAG